jgi:uncharacterized protein GlcG (DUF336 family)
MRNLVETLEQRQHLSITLFSQLGIQVFGKPMPKATPQPAIVADAVIRPAKTVRAAPAAGTAETLLTSDQVRQILAQAASQARPGQAVAVSDREGNILGVYATAGATQDSIDKAIVRARTGAYFQSTQNAFTTRTARFIIQDHFPWPIRNTAGGPLYGVQFSTFPGSDIVSAAQTPGVSADPGGLPLYINGNRPAGGIGVAGDGKDIAPRANLAAPGQKVFSGFEERDFDESVALAGATGNRAPANVRLNAMPKEGIRATKIFLPGPGLRFPFTKSPIARSQPFQTLDQLIASGAGTLVVTPTTAQPNPYPKVDPSVFGISGELKNTTVPGFGIVGSDDPVPDDQRLTVDDVNTIIRDAVQQALKDRAAIRLPIGVPVIIHVAVTDRDGDVLGVFRMNDGTNFSFDVAVQKARTAAFFSDDTHAYSTRAIGFMSQKFFAPGITPGGTSGPLFELQNALSTNPGNMGTGPVANGITIFPGGVPLYKNGVLVGGIGVSGDGVEQDDRVAFGGSSKFQPVKQFRSDYRDNDETARFITSKVQELQNTYNLGGRDFVTQARTRFAAKFDFRLPYVKFARNPSID